MSVFVQEVLGLLKRNFVKTTLNPTDDYIQFVRKGAFNRAKASAGGFAPQGQALSISAGSWLCSQTGPQGLGRFVSTVKESGEVAGTIPMFWLRQGQCSWHSLKDSLLSQDTADPVIYVGKNTAPTDLIVYNRVYIPKLQPNNPSPNFRGQVIFADAAGELQTNDNFTFTNGNNFLVNGPVNTSFGSITTGASSPPTSTRVNNKLILSGPVFDAASAGGGTGLPNIGQVLIAREDPNNAGVSDGRVLWGDPSGVPDLKFGELIIGYKNPQPAPGTIVPAVASFSTPLGTGNAGEVLASGGPNGFPGWIPNPSIGGSGTPYRLSAFSTLNTLMNSLLVQDNNLPIVDPGFANQTITNDGKWINTGTMKLLDVPQDATQEKVLVLDTNTGQVKFRFANSIGVQGGGTLRRVPLWSPDGANIQNSLLIQSGFVQPPSNYPVADPNFTNQKLTNDGSLQQTKELYLDTVTQDDTLAEVLVRDPSSANEVKFRNVATISPAVGFDTLTMSTTANWNQTFLNAYISLDDTTVPYRSIKGMTTLTDGQTGVVIAENVKQGTLLADDVIRFPNAWGNPGNLYDNRISWAAGFDNGYPTSTLLYGESLKFKYHNYEIAGGGFTYKYVLYWESCCKLFSLNTCPTVQGATYNVNEDDSGGISQTLIAVDDGYGGYTPVYTISALNNPAAGTLTLTNSSTGAFTFIPALNFNGSTFFTFTYNDGYCESAPGTITINVLPVPDAPIWSSTDPVTAGTYSNLTGGDAWTYTWTTSDPDTPCASLIYDITVNDGSGPVTIYTSGGGQTGLTWLTFTPDSPHTCTGTLAGTYPVTAGNFEVSMNVSDGTGSDTQIFTIGGLTVTKDTYFVFYSDTSGSMNSTIQETAQMSSVPEVKCKVAANGSINVSLVLATGNQPGRVNNFSGTTDDSFLCVVPNMLVSGNGIVSGTTVASVGTPAGGQITITLSQALSGTQPNDIITFTLTQNQKEIDYANANNFRNLLQDFYATGQTLAQELAAGVTPNPVTNGQNDYDSHLYWYHNSVERPLGYLGFQAQQDQGIAVTTIGPTGYFPNAENIVVMAWADESNDGPATYKARPQETGTTTWNDRASSTNANIIGDVQKVKAFINGLEAAAGNNTIYRGIAFRVQNGGPNGNDLEEIMGPNGFAQTGGRTANGYSNAFLPQATAYTVAESLYDKSGGVGVTRITYSGNVNPQPSNGSVYYYNLVRAELNAIGFNL
jgi:hypothetical protein